MVPIRVQAVYKGGPAGGVAGHERGSEEAETEARPIDVSSCVTRAIHFTDSVICRDALQTLTSTRQSSLLNSFLDALTKGGPNGLPRPIELHAHDPTRYVGDMLAWIHQTTASEHEFLESLFAVKETKRMVGSERRNEDMSEEEAMVREAMDKDLEGLGRPLKVS